MTTEFRAPGDGPGTTGPCGPITAPAGNGVNGSRGWPGGACAATSPAVRAARAIATSMGGRGEYMGRMVVNPPARLKASLARETQ